MAGPAFAQAGIMLAGDCLTIHWGIGIYGGPFRAGGVRDIDRG